MLINSTITLSMFILYNIYLFQVKTQYNMLLDSVKQISLQNFQGELDTHTETLSGQVRAHQAQQALSFHKVDMEASVMEVSFLLFMTCGQQLYVSIFS